MANIFCTLAMGHKYAGHARFLADDLRDFDQTLAVVTDQPGIFRGCRNVHVTGHYPASFSYHDKRLALQSALKLGDTAIFIDADCALRFGVPRELARHAFSYVFAPGFHGWSIKRADVHDYTYFENLAKGWGLPFDRNQIVYVEGLFAMRSEGAKDRLFFDIWERFYEEAQARNFNGAGEGVCFGIAAQAGGLTCHGTLPMRESRLGNVLWHTQLNWRLRRFYHFTFAVRSRLRREPAPDWNQLEFCGRSPSQEAEPPGAKSAPPSAAGAALSDLIAIVSHHALGPEEIRAACADLLAASVPDETKADFLRAWSQRGETAAELAGCAEAFLPQALDPRVRGSWNNRPLLDCCGTGGGGLNLLNISTGLMFILGALGIPVVKHGNRGLTKKSGSADVLEALGIRIDLAPDQVPRCLEEVGCAFLFAPAYHPSFAAAASVRRRLAAEGRRTIFNLLGPLLNPARPDARLVGVFNAEHVALYRQALEEMACPRFSVVCGQDADSGRMLGEASANGLTLVGSTLKDPTGGPFENLQRRFPTDADALPSLLVRDARESAERLEAILRNDEPGLARETLLLNAALAAWTHGAARSLEEGLAQATEALDSGRALERLTRWRNFSNA